MNPIRRRDIPVTTPDVLRAYITAERRGRLPGVFSIKTDGEGPKAGVFQGTYELAEDGRARFTVGDLLVKCIVMVQPEDFADETSGIVVRSRHQLQ